MGCFVKKHFLLFCLFFFALFTSCIKNVVDPLSLSPDNPYSTWTPDKKSRLVCSAFCETLLPPSFPDKALSLAELIDIALQNNPKTKQTWAKARSAAAVYGQSLSKYYPIVSADASYTRVRQSFAQLSEAIGVVEFFLTTVNPALNITYTLLDFGKRKYSSEAARQSLFFADWTHNQEIQTIIQTVMSDFYSYLYEKQALIAAEEDVENARATLDAATQKMHVGVAALGDVAQARSSYMKQKIGLLNQKKALELSYAVLAEDLGLPANLCFSVEPMPEVVCPQADLESVDVLVAKAQQKRQDFLASKANLLSKKALLKEAKSHYFPDITSSFNVGKNYYVNISDSDDYNFTLRFNLSMPLFEGFFRKNRVKEAKAHVQLAQAQLLDKELEIIKEISVSHYDVQTNAEQLTASQEYVKSAETEYKISLANYKAGTNTILDVLNAQSHLADARKNLADSKKQWFTSLADLAYNTGSLCTDLPDPLDPSLQPVTFEKPFPEENKESSYSKELSSSFLNRSSFPDKSSLPSTNPIRVME